MQVLSPCLCLTRRWAATNGEPTVKSDGSNAPRKGRAQAREWQGEDDVHMEFACSEADHPRGRSCWHRRIPAVLSTWGMVYASSCRWSAGSSCSVLWPLGGCVLTSISSPCPVCYATSRVGSGGGAADGQRQDQSQEKATFRMEAEQNSRGVCASGCEP